MSHNDLYRKTTMPDLLEKLQNHYGTEIGQSIFADSCTRLAAALDSVDIKDNKAISSEILDILAIDNLEIKARDMGLRKKGPEDVLLIIVGGEERGY